ncbi:MAG: PAS domain S-box protein [Bacteroidota bacterium]
MRILVVEDNEGDYFLVHEYLHEIFPGIELTHNMLLQEAINSLQNANFDIILLDLSLPDSNGMDSIVEMIKLANGIPVIVLTGFGNLQFAIDSLKLGVQDYLLKDDVNALILQKSIGYSIERNKISTTMRISEAKYRYLFDNNPDSIFIFDPSDFIILDANQTAAQILGFTKSEFLTMSIWDIYESDNQMEIDDLIEKLRMQNGAIQNLVLKCKSNKGDLFYIDLALHKINYNDKIAVLTIGTDVTENILLERKLADERKRTTREIAEAVIIAQERERTEIGLELHDNVNQILAGSMMYLGLLKKELKIESPLYRDIEKLITEAIQEIRTLSHNLIPPSLNELELSDALDHIITIAKKSTEFEVQKDFYDFNEEEISNDLKLAIYRIIQEQFNNIFKHAKAKHIFIRLYQEEGKLILIIKDDGIGFDQSATSHGVGLINIQTRASLFNGEMKINSSLGNGTEVMVTFLL